MQVNNDRDQENVTCQCDHLTSFSILLVSVHTLGSWWKVVHLVVHADMLLVVMKIYINISNNYYNTMKS